MNYYTINYSAFTSAGQRKENQDRFLADGCLSSPREGAPQQCAGQCDAPDKLRVFAVCDGIGMYRDSGAAAETALRKIKERCDEVNQSEEDFQEDQLEEWVEESIMSAKRAMEEYCEKAQAEGSCTIALLAVANGRYVAANIGDSPVFLWKEGRLTELSERHNMANFKRRLGLTPVPGEERILLSHLADEDLTIEKEYGIIDDRCAFILCTDGVSNAIPRNDMIRYLEENHDAASLVSLSEGLTGADNCTALTVRIECPEQ